MKPRPEEQETIAQYCDRVGCETALAYYLAKAYIELQQYPEHEAIIKWAKDGWNPESLIYPEG